MNQVWKTYAAEFIGTYFLVLLGCGAVILAQLPDWSLNTALIPAVFGGVVAVMIYAVGHISGAHFNPAVSIAFCVSRHFPLERVMGYIAAQACGAVAASATHHWIFGPVGHAFGATLPALQSTQALGVEILISFMLMFVITAVATDTRAQGQMAGLAIGGTVALAAAVGGPLTGASMNPARSFGPALLSGDFSAFWIYLLGPVSGAVLGSLAYQSIRCPPESEGSSGACC